MRIWIAATQIGLFVVASFFLAWAVTAIQERAFEMKITMMRTPHIRELERAAYLAGGCFTIITSAFLVASVLMVIS